MLFTRFLVGNIFCALLACLILFIKKLLGKRISLKFHYLIWSLLVLSMLAVFLPISIFQQFYEVHPSITNTAPEQASSIGADLEYTMQTYTWASDLSDTVNIADHSHIVRLFGIVWTIGALFTLSLYIKSVFQLRKLKCRAVHPAERVASLFSLCEKKANIRKKIVLLQSVETASAFSFGVKPCCVVLPEKTVLQASDQELEHIILHEMMHVRHRDIFSNYALCIMQVLYWCNPLVWLAFRRLREDREAYCDWAVLNTFDSADEQLDYGYTLLRFAQQSGGQVLCAKTGLGGSKKQIRQRIKSIAEFQRESKKSLICGISTILIVAILASLQVPVLAVVTGNSDIYVPSTELTIQEVDFSTLFGSGDGCAVIYDFNKDSYTVFNPSRMTVRVTPCSTYKIYCALNALEHDVISPEDSLRSWDGTVYDYDTWNRDQDLSSAMHGSVNWYFQQLDEQEETDELIAFCEEIEYGNCEVTDANSAYWFGSGLKVSALEQIELLRKLYNNSFGFDPDNIEAVKEAMLLSDYSGYRLYGKTGTGESGNVNVLGWFVGYIETADNIYFFAVNVQDNNGADGQRAIELTYDIFTSIGIEL